MDKRRINVRAVVVRGSTILAVKHKNSDGGESPYWALPGGGLDPLESLQEGVQREIMEELGVQARVGKLLFVQQFMSKRDHYNEELEFHFLVEDSPAYDSIDFNKTSHGAAELARIAFVDPHEVPIMPRYLSELDIAAYANEEHSPYLFSELVK